MELVLDDASELGRTPKSSSANADGVTIAPVPAKPKAEQGRCRTNSRRGLTDPTRLSYPPVEAVCRAFEVLRTVNKLRIASVNGIFEATGIPKSTIVRMLETLMSEGYVVRDNMCGGYRVTQHVNELTEGYDGVSRVIEVARPFAIELTQRIKWPIGLGVEDGDAMAIQFWTGTISPWAHTNTVLGLRPEFRYSAMGRAYLAFCDEEERERRIRELRNVPGMEFDETEERTFRGLLERARQDGYAIRDPRTKPYRTTTLAMPVLDHGKLQAVVTISFFRSALRPSEVHEKIIAPLRGMIDQVESALNFMKTGEIHQDMEADEMELGF